MISTKSGGYWAKGIILRYRGYQGSHPESWGGSVDFYDDGLLNDDPAAGKVSTEGTLRTRYFVESRDGNVALTAVIDTLIADAGRLGIRFEGTVTDKPALWYESEDEDFAPEGWRHMLRAQADRIGWDSPRVDAEKS